MTVKVLDLCSGIGGFSLGFEQAGMQTVAFCEIDPYCQKILRKHWPTIPVFRDVKDIDYEGEVNLISAGYPCQPFSYAGQRRGEKDHRHLWPYIIEKIRYYKPAWFVGENVAGHISLGLDEVLTDLENENYETTVFNIPACAVYAPHQRKRIWIIAHAKGKQNCRLQQQQLPTDTFTGIDTNPDSKRLERFFRRTQKKLQLLEVFSTFEKFQGGNQNKLPQSTIRRGDDGFSDRVDRLKALGNAVVPQIPEIIGHAILEVERVLRA